MHSEEWSTPKFKWTRAQLFQNLSKYRIASKLTAPKWITCVFPYATGLLASLSASSLVGKTPFSIKSRSNNFSQTQRWKEYSKQYFKWIFKNFFSFIFYGKNKNKTHKSRAHEIKVKAGLNVQRGRGFFEGFAAAAPPPPSAHSKMAHQLPFRQIT